MRVLIPLSLTPLLASAAKFSDSFCSKTLCVHAELNRTSSTVNYKVSSASKASATDIGWAAIGFGTKMSNADMIVLWANNDGSMTLSHRVAPGHEMPHAIAHPSRVATPLPHLSTFSKKKLEFVFSVPLDENAATDHIFASSPANPGTSDVDAPIRFHTLDFGRFALNYIGSDKDPLKTQRGLAIAHGVLMTLGFLVALPIGGLVARYGRTRTPAWFKAHWMSQTVVAGPLILVASILSIVAIFLQRDNKHFDDAHKQTGLVLLILYFLQIYFGYYIHVHKSDSNLIYGRPLQNYLHPIMGAVVIGLAFIQVHSGYAHELAVVGVSRIPKSVEVTFYSWLAIVIVSYAAGLTLLPKQYQQEAESRGDYTPNERAPLIRPDGA